MILCIDLGNSDGVAALFSKDHPHPLVVARWKRQELLLKLTTLPSIHSFSPWLSGWATISYVIISSVVASITPRIEALFASHKIPFHTVTTASPHPFQSVPTQLGSDLLCNAVAAFQRASGGGMVLDFGTALTGIAYWDSRIQGGVITCGVSTLIQTLKERAEGLRDTEPLWKGGRPISFLGKTTQEALYTGVIFGLLGTLQEWRKQFHLIAPQGAPIFLTGGETYWLSPLLEQHSPEFQQHYHIDPLLTLKGGYHLAQTLL